MTAGPVTVHGRYRLGGLLGQGGMGKVWRAQDEVLDRAVALKEILLPGEGVAGDREALHRQTLREARAAARLTHPGVARVYDAFEGDGRAWIVMEYVPSRSLQQVIDEDGPLDPARAARIGLDVLAALRAAHAAGVRHRDVKPANVLLGDDGRVVLTDFGVAAVDGESLATSSGIVVGSPQYMAPERVRDGEATTAADLWSLGATLFAAVEGRSPYARGSVMETITAIAAEEPDPPQHAGPLRPVLDGLLRKDPAARIDAGETARLLRAVADPAPVPVPAPAPRRRRRLPLLAAVVAVILLAAAWFLVRDPSSPTASGPTSAPSAVPSATPSSVPSAASSAAGSSPSSSRSPSPPPAERAGSGALPARPAGWTDYHDPTGFALYVPSGWTRSKEGSIVYFRSAGRVLGIDQTDAPQWDPVGDWRGKADYRVRRGDFPAYHEIHIIPVAYFLKAADWEFTFTRGGTRQHVNNRGFITSRHQAYGIYWQTTDAAWSGARDDLQLVFDSFRPAGD